MFVSCNWKPFSFYDCKRTFHCLYEALKTHKRYYFTLIHCCFMDLVMWHVLLETGLDFSSTCFSLLLILIMFFRIKWFWVIDTVFHSSEWLSHAMMCPHMPLRSAWWNLQCLLLGDWEESFKYLRAKKHNTLSQFTVLHQIILEIGRWAWKAYVVLLVFFLSLSLALSHSHIHTHTPIHVFILYRSDCI